MPTKTITETVTRCVDVCDTCGNECTGIGYNRCAICSNLACSSCGHSEMEHLLSHERTWLCHKCHTLGIVYKQSIRRLKDQIINERAGWRKLGIERSK